MVPYICGRPTLSEGVLSEGVLSADAARGGPSILTGRRALVFGGLFALAGCAAPLPKSTTVIVLIGADATINPAPDEKPSPVLIRLYTLRTATAFAQADFQSLFNNDAQVLGADMLAKREYVIAPAGRQSYSEDVPADTAFLGIIVGFRSIDTATWRAAVPIAPGVNNNVTIGLSGLTVAAKVKTSEKS